MHFHLPLGWGKCNHRATLICPQSDCLEFYDWVQLSLHHRQNVTLVKSVYETAPKSLFWAPHVYQDLSTRHDWPVKKAIVNLPIRMKGNSKRTSGNSLNPLRAQNKDLAAASQTLLNEVKLRLQRRLVQLSPCKTQVARSCAHFPDFHVASEAQNGKRNHQFSRLQGVFPSVKFLEISSILNNCILLPRIRFSYTNYQVENLVHSTISLPRRGKKPALKSTAKWPETKKNIKKFHRLERYPVSSEVS